jgi:hypothetical protein
MSCGDELGGNYNVSSHSSRAFTARSMELSSASVTPGSAPLWTNVVTALGEPAQLQAAPLIDSSIAGTEHGVGTVGQLHREGLDALQDELNDSHHLAAFADPSAGAASSPTSIAIVPSIIARR